MMQQSLALDCRQDRNRSRESRRLYQTVLALRRLGNAVYRRGERSVSVNGAQLTVRQFYRVARDLGVA